MKVLVIDDEELIRRSLQRAFASRGHIVEVAENGESGLEKWKVFSPDLIFLDVVMPRLTGLQVLEQLDASEVGKVILMSAFSEIEREGVRNRFPIKDFFSKPFEDIFSIVEWSEKKVNE